MYINTYVYIYMNIYIHIKHAHRHSPTLDWALAASMRKRTTAEVSSSNRLAATSSSHERIFTHSTPCTQKETSSRPVIRTCVHTCTRTYVIHAYKHAYIHAALHVSRRALFCVRMVWALDMLPPNAASHRAQCVVKPMLLRRVRVRLMF